MAEFSNDGYLNMELLRFTTAGSVDDGKSTLIGRLLYDSKSIFEDQMEAIKDASERRGEETMNLALLTDGLRAEREQGITIDVAYRYFATPARKFIIADTPGHIQYTRNMVTGASTANLAIVLVDARKGVVEQTCRHAYIASLLKIPHLLICINKMDLVDWDQQIFNNICNQFKSFATNLEIKDIHYIPISALNGDNVVDRSLNSPWYEGSTLLNLLETVHIANDNNMEENRFPVQYVIRPNTDAYHDYRGYAGRIAGGVFKIGDEVIIHPSGFTSKIKSIDLMGKTLSEAFPPMSVNICLEDDIDISRGDMISKIDNQPKISQDIELMICWMNERKMIPNGKYMIKHTTKEARCIIKEILHKININNLDIIEDDKVVGLNDIAKIKIRTSLPLIHDSYKTNRITGSIILIDEATNETVGAGMII